MVTRDLTNLRASWLPILQVHLIFALLGVVLLGPLFSLMLQGLLAMSGSPAVSDQDIALLFLSPLGILSGLLLASVFLAINAMEIGALLAIALATKHGFSYSPIQAVVYALRHGISLLQLTLVLSLRVLAYLLPLLALLGGIAWFLLTDYDINFYLSEQPPRFLFALGLSLALLAPVLWLMGRKLLSWCLALPLVLFTDISNWQALAESERLTRNSKPEIVRRYVGSLAAAGLIALIPAYLFNLLGGWVVDAQIDRLAPLVFLLGGLIIIWLLMNFFIIAFTLGLICFTTAELFGRLGPSLSDHYLQAELAGRHLPGIEWSTRQAVFFTVVAAGLAGFVGGWLLNGIQTEDRISIVAHRGAAGVAPENTVASIRRAIADGSDWVEIDVQETRDGQVVVVHDSDFMKLAGNPLKVWDGSLAEIQALDVGSWFDPKFEDERVPTLEQVLAETRGRAGLLIELKYYGHDQQLERRVVDIVEASGMADEVSIMSLSLAGVQALQVLRPGWTTGLLAATALGDLSRTNVDFLAVSQRLGSANFIKRAHAAGKQVVVWTVNDALSMSKWMSMGVDGLITDEPALARKVLQERARMSSAERLMLRASQLLGKPLPKTRYRDNSP